MEHTENREVLKKFSKPSSRMEHKANMLWIPPDSTYNINQVVKSSHNEDWQFAILVEILRWYCRIGWMQMISFAILVKIPRWYCRTGWMPTSRRRRGGSWWSSRVKMSWHRHPYKRWDLSFHLNRNRSKIFLWWIQPSLVEVLNLTLRWWSYTTPC